MDFFSFSAWKVKVVVWVEILSIYDLKSKDVLNTIVCTWILFLV